MRRHLPPPPRQPHLGHAAGGAGSRGRGARNGHSTLCSRTNASPFWIMLLLVFGKLDNGMIRVQQRNNGCTWYATEGQSGSPRRTTGPCVLARSPISSIAWRDFEAPGPPGSSVGNRTEARHPLSFRNVLMTCELSDQSKLSRECGPPPSSKGGGFFWTHNVDAE